MESKSPSAQSSPTPPLSGKPASTPAGSPAKPRAVITHPNFAAPVRPISEFVTHPDFPRNALGEHVDIGGYPGVVVEIVKHSIRVRASEGGTMSYNINTLRKLYGPHVPPPEEPAAAPAPAAEPPPPARPEVKRNFIANPDFNAPLIPIDTVVDLPDYPKCVFGKHLDLRGFAGVVIEIVHQSLKVRSREGSTRSYNADGLRRLYSSKKPRP